MIRKLCRWHSTLWALTRVAGLFLVLALISWTATLTNPRDSCDGGASSEDISSRKSSRPAATSDGKFHQVGDSETYIYSASYDGRYENKYIRMFGMQNRNGPSRLRCRFELGNGVKIDLPPETSYPIYKHWPSDKLLYQAYYYGCDVPDVFNFRENFTFSVSHEGDSFGTSIPLNVPRQSSQGPSDTSFDISSSHDIVVCVKAIWGHVNATRLVEWFEFLRLLGVHKVVMYDTTTLGPAVRILKYYQDIGMLELIHFDFALRMNTIMQKDPFLSQLLTSDMILEQTYLVSMNDCYYRHYSKADYVMIIDFDEIIVPNDVRPLRDMLREAEREGMNASAFLFQTAWHLEEFGATRPELPGYLHTQKFTKRSPVMHSQPKALVTSFGAIAVNWHGTVTMPIGYGFQGNQYLPWQRYGYVHHYRSKCKYDSPKCAVIAQMVEDDDVIPKYRRELSANVETILRHLHLI